MKTTSYALCMILSLAALPCMAEEGLDPASEEALRKTQALLNNSKERDKAIQENGNALTVDAQIRALFGSGADRDQVYSLSSKIFEDLVRTTGGDVSKMQDLLIQAKNNPKAFYDSLSPANREALSGLAAKVPPPPSGTPSAPATRP